jgi:hypothetical protein
MSDAVNNIKNNISQALFKKMKKARATLLPTKSYVRVCISIKEQKRKYVCQ